MLMLANTAPIMSTIARAIDHGDDLLDAARYRVRHSGGDVARLADKMDEKNGCASLESNRTYRYTNASRAAYGILSLRS